jgi:hypothetical protein
MIIAEFGITMKLGRLIKMCLNEASSRVRIGKISLTCILLGMVWKKEMLYCHCFSPLI